MNKNNKMIIILTIFSLIFTFIGGTFAYWNWQTSESQRTNIVANIPNMCMVMVDGGGSIDSSNISMMPATCTNTNNAIIKEINSSVSFSDSEVPVEISFSLKINDISEELTDSTNFRYAITNSPADCVSNAIASGTFNGVEVNDTIDLVSNIYTIKDLDDNNEINSKYYLYIWLDKEETNPNTAGTSFNLSLEAQCNADNDIDASGASAPVLDSGMIPVTIANDGTVTTVSKDDSSWYNYSYKKWANAILVSESSRSSYLNTSGVEVNQSDILAYYVWIPRYKYKIWTTSVSSTGNEQTIDIVFENKEIQKSAGAMIGEYLTHPAFTFGDQELDGFWVGKFETTGSASIPTVLPNTTSLRRQKVSTQFQTSLKFAGGTLSDGNVTFAGSSTYGLTTNTDSHMMKNSEWGAVAYLSHSIYGINEEIYINNSSYYYTGRSGGAVGGSTNTSVVQYPDDSTSTTLYSSYGYYTWLGQVVNYDGTIGKIIDTSLGTKASTTGNITGIYDMSGGSDEYVMEVYLDSDGNLRSGYKSNLNSGFNGVLYDSGNNTLYTSGIDFPTNKYYSIMSFSGCDVDICRGRALYETIGWYSDYRGYANVSYPWFIRGGCYSDKSDSGIFYSFYKDGSSDGSVSWRSVLAVTN